MRKWEENENSFRYFRRTVFKLTKDSFSLSESSRPEFDHISLIRIPEYIRGIKIKRNASMKYISIFHGIFTFVYEPVVKIDSLVTST